MDTYEIRIQRELKRAKLAAHLINFCFIVYGLFLITDLGVKILNWSPLTKETWYIFLGLSIVLSLVYSASRQSLGYLVVLSTNRILRRRIADGGKPWIRQLTKVFAWSLILLTLTLGFVLTETSFTALFSTDGLAGAHRIFSAMMNPELGILMSVLEAMVQTVFIALIATALALPISFIFGFLCARNLMNSQGWTLSLYHFLRLIFNFTRSVEPLIWAIIFSVWVGIGPFAGMLALMLHSVSSLAKNYSEQIECVELGPIEAIEATGANRIQVIAYAVVPQVMLPFLAFTIYRWDINVRMATIIGLVGGGGIGNLLMQYQGLGRWNEVGTIILVIAAVVWFMDYVSGKVREAIY